MVADGDIGGIPVSAEVMRSGKVVPMLLCGEYRAHIETKIDNMQKSIKWSIYLASAGMGLIVILFQYYLAVIH